MDIQTVTQSLRLREYYYMVLRRKKFFLGAVALSVVISVILCFTLPKQYRASTILLVEEEKILNPLIAGLAVSPRVADRMRTLREELVSWQRLTLLVEKLNLDEHVKSPYQYEKLIQSLREHIEIRMKGYDIITVSFEGSDPKQAQQIVQTLADIIVQGNLTSQNLEADSAIGFIGEELQSYRGKLEESEGQLREFKEVYNATLPVATRMNEELVSLKMELNNLLVENTEEHPRVLQTRKLIEQLEGRRDEQMQQAQQMGVDIDPSDYAQLVSSVPRQEQHMARLVRDYSVNAKIYESLLQRLETAKISQRLEDSDKGTKFRVIEPARLPLRAAKPNKFFLLLGGLIIGLGLGSAVVYILELSDNSIRSVDEARFLLELPILGSITTIRPEELLAEERLRRVSSV